MSLHSTKFKLKSYDNLMILSYQRILKGFTLDEKLKPYSKEFLNKILNYFEEREMYEECAFISNFIKQRFDHNLNYNKYELH